MNGNIPTNQMVVRQGLYLWPSTAAKFDAVDADLVSRGYPHMIISQPYGAYRSYADQVQVKKLYGAGAATPGYSNHGLGRAWDINNISHYPDAVIAAVAKAHGLVRDAGNGHGQIESWHLHDADGIAPAGGGSAPISENTDTKHGDEEMRLIQNPKYPERVYWLGQEYICQTFDPAEIAALNAYNTTGAGIGIWKPTRDNVDDAAQDFWRILRNHGISRALIEGKFDTMTTHLENRWWSAVTPNPALA